MESLLYFIMHTSVKGVRLVVFLSLIGVFVYYRTREEVLPSTTFDNNGANMIVKLSPEEAQKYLGIKEMTARSGSNRTFSDQQTVRKQAQDVLDFVVINNRVYPKNSSLARKAHRKFPVLKPSYGSFLRQLDFSGYSEKDREFLESRLGEMVKRAKHLSRKCNPWRNLTSSLNLRLIWDTKHNPNVLWCPIHKVASTTWSINFLRLAHFNDDNKEILELPAARREKMKYMPKYGAKQGKLDELYPPPEDLEERTQVFKNSLRVLIVRHPFSRMISAYRDKMLKMKPRPTEHKFRELQLNIIAKYRSPNSTETSPFPTFPEFIKHVIDSTETLNTRDDWMTKVKCWIPYWAQCNICASDYNLILKLETMEEDERFLVTLTNMKELKRLKSHEWRHLQNKTSSGELIKQYFSQLTVHQIKELQKRYLPDFLLFKYNVDKELLEKAQK